MKKSKLNAVLAVVLSLFVLGCLVGVRSSMADDTIVLRVADIYPKKHPIAFGFLNYFAEELEERSNGRVQIDYFDQETLCSATDILDATGDGTAHIGNMIYAGSKIPLIFFQQLPGVFSDEETVAASRAFWKVSQKYLDPEFEKHNVKLIYGFTTSNYQVYTKGKAIREIEDLKGVKLRSSGEVLPKSVGKLGASPVGIPVTEAYEAMERGVIDGISLAVPSVKSYSFYELLEYATLNMNLGGYPNTYAINLDTWNNLPKDIQELIKDMSMEVTEKASEHYSAMIEKDLKQWQDKGIELIHLSKDESQKKNEMLASVWAEWISKMQDRGVPMKDLITDWEKALAEEGIELNPRLLSKLPWNQ